MPQHTDLDLAVLVADPQARFVFLEILQRHQAIAIRPINFEIVIHPRRDPGVIHDPHEWLRPFLNRAKYAVACLDYEGCGSNHPGNIVERNIETLLIQNGWRDRAIAIAIEPELESWFWNRSKVVADVCEWRNGIDDLYGWLTINGWLRQNDVKPDRPKEALEAVVKKSEIAFSGSLHRQVAKEVTLARCTDPAFLKLKSTLQAWFPQQSTTGLSP